MTRPAGTYPCCYGDDGQLTANVHLVPDHPDVGPDREVWVCRACDRRHVRVTVDPGRFQALGAALR
jgi:hypothetical protein